MIELFSRNTYAGFGLETALRSEGIAFRKVTTLDDARGPLFVSAVDLNEDEIRALADRPAVVFIGGTRFAQTRFGVRGALLSNASFQLPLQQQFWPEDVRDVGSSCGIGSVSVPSAPLVSLHDGAVGEQLAALQLLAGEQVFAAPLVIRKGRTIWCLADPGAALATLISESYVTQTAHSGADRPYPSPWSKAGFAAYYAAPEALRKPLREHAYAGLQARLARIRPLASVYPCDATGWLLSRFVAQLAALVCGGEVPSLAKWPAPYTSAASITHDIEPCRFAYTHGLDRLLDRIDKSGHPATINLVAESASAWLGDRERTRVGGHTIGCHGLTHRGDPVRTGADTLDAQLERARNTIETTTGVAPKGYRSPRLDRSRELIEALDRTGWSYDSSFPDVDRENTHSFGTGVRLNLPYRPPIGESGGRVRASRCLELPVTAPDCIQPLFFGESVRALRDTVKRKADYICATQGMYVAIVHGGVFGDEDALVRGEHLDFVVKTLSRAGMWLTSQDQIADWWHRREEVYATIDGGGIEVTNRGGNAIEGLVVRYGGNSYPLPLLAPNDSHRIELKTASERQTAAHAD